MAPILAFLVLIAPLLASAQSAKTAYQNCEDGMTARDRSFRLCLSQALEKDPSDLKADFERRQRTMMEYFRTKDGRLLESGCHISHINLKKEGPNLRLQICNARQECKTYSHLMGIVINEKQRDEIAEEEMVVTKKKFLGKELHFRSNPANFVERSCESERGLCFRLFKKILGFTPVADSSHGLRGNSVEKMEASAIDRSLGQQDLYHIQKKVEFVAPPSVFQKRLPELFSDRESSPLGRIIDLFPSERTSRDLLFNYHLVTLLEKRLPLFLKSKEKEMLFSFFSDGQICADPIHQKNLRRGMGLAEAFLFRSKDKSGDLTNTMGQALKSVGNGFSQLITGFLKDQVKEMGTQAN